MTRSKPKQSPPKEYHGIADYYDYEYANKEMLRCDVPLLLAHMPKKPVDALELACGTGRAAIPLAQVGHRVVGVDYDRPMLKRAEEKRQIAGLTSRQLQLVHGDIRQLKLPEKFDWIVLLFNTFLAFTTLKDQDAVLQSVRRHLKPRGMFWLDIFQPNLQMLASPVSENLDSNLFYVPHLRRTVLATTTIKRDPAQQRQDVTFTYRWFDDAAIEHIEKRQFSITFIFPRELCILLERNGLKIVHLYGNYDASPLDADSPRMIAQCMCA